MTLTALGCAGGIAEGRHTTSFLLAGHTLLDAGTGVGRLSLEQMRAVDRVLITHAHMDHIAGLALMMATVISHRRKPVQVYAPADVLDVLRAHIFNWQVWPDFSKLPNESEPSLEFYPLEPGRRIWLTDDIQVEPILLTHTVPSYAYLLSRGDKKLCFCGDTGATEQLWSVINREGGVDQLFIEMSYPQGQEKMAQVSGHHSIDTLYDDLAKLKHPGRICLMHHKPGYGLDIREQVLAHDFSVRYDIEFVDEDSCIAVL